MSTSSSFIKSIKGAVFEDKGTCRFANLSTNETDFFNIETEHTVDFWKQYCDKAEEGLIEYALIERPEREDAPIAFDIEVSYPEQTSPDTITQFLTRVAVALQESIRTYIDLDFDPFWNLIFVLKTNQVDDAEEHKGDHATIYRIQAPCVRHSVHEQRSNIGNLFIATFERMFGQYNTYEPTNDWKDSINQDFLDQSWALFKAVNADGEHFEVMLEVGDVITSKEGDITISPIRLDEQYILNHMNDVRMSGISGSKLSNFCRGYYRYWLPVILSPNFHYKVYTERNIPHLEKAIEKPKEKPNTPKQVKPITPKKDQKEPPNSSAYSSYLPSSFQELFSTTSSISISNAAASSSDEEDHKQSMSFQVTIDLLQRISLEQMRYEKFWQFIGSVLANCWTSEWEENAAFKTWCELTTKYLSKEFIYDCQCQWESLRNGRYTYRSLAYILRRENPKAYDAWHYSWANDHIIKSLSGLHADVAEAFYRQYWLDFLCARSKDNSWFEYRKSRWVTLDNANGVNIKFSKDFVLHYEHLRTQLSKDGTTARDDEQRSKIEGQFKKVCKLIEKLKTKTFMDTVIKQAKDLFYRERFHELLDADPCLLGCENGVIEVDSKSASFRLGIPEDFISMTTKVVYKEYKNDDKVMKQLHQWLTQIFPNNELLHYFLKDMASMLYGRNSEKKFRIWSGQGDNSKSMLVKLVGEAFGLYKFDLPIEAFCGSSAGAGGPTPHLARGQNTHVAISAEPEDDKELKKGAMKRLTGGDTMFVRFLHENGKDMTLTFNIIYMCNKIPSFHNPDKASKNRVVVVPFLSTWCEDPPASEEEQYKQKRFKADRNFESKIPSFGAAFLFMLTKYYAIYKAEGCKIPCIVTETTTKYWNETDIYRHFIQERLLIKYKDKQNTIVDDSFSISSTDVYNCFRQWYESNYPKEKCPSSMLVKQELMPRIPSKLDDNSRWKGVQIIAAASAKS